MTTKTNINKHEDEFQRLKGLGINIEKELNRPETQLKVSESFHLVVKDPK